MTRFSGNAGYALFWPPDFLVQEIESLIRRHPGPGLDWEWVQEAMLLLRQAFTSQAPANDFMEMAGAIDPRGDHSAADSRDGPEVISGLQCNVKSDQITGMHSRDLWQLAEQLETADPANGLGTLPARQ